MQPLNVSSFSRIQRFYCDHTLVVPVSQHALCPLCMNIFRMLVLQLNQWHLLVVQSKTLNCP